MSQNSYNMKGQQPATVGHWNIFARLHEHEEALTAEKHVFITSLLEKLDSVMIEQQRLSDDLEQAKYLNQKYHVDLRSLKEDNDRLKSEMAANPFVLVLIDGDNALFLDEFISVGKSGGEGAARKLMTNITDYLKTLAGFEPHWQIIIRVYAKLAGLSKTYVDTGVLTHVSHFYSFVSGFNAVYELCEYIDAGTDKEAADADIKTNLALFSKNVHCKHIILAFSGDNSYAGSLRRFDDDKWHQHITLIEALPFPPDLKQVATKFPTQKFSQIFRDTKLNGPTKDVRTEKPNSFASIATTPATLVPTVVRTGLASLTKTSQYPVPNSNVTSTAKRVVEICWNKKGHRIDRPLGTCDNDLFRQLKTKRLCNRHFLTRCTDSFCSYIHDETLNSSQLSVLRHVARLLPCSTIYCDDHLCTSSHRCPQGLKCKRAQECKYSVEMHDSDSEVHERETYEV